MKAIFFLVCLLPLLLPAQSHQRYEFSLPDTLTFPVVAEVAVPSDGKVVALSSGGNVDRTNRRVSWGAILTPTSSLWIEMIFPEGVTSTSPGPLSLTSSDGSTTTLTAAANPIPNSALSLFAAPDLSLDLTSDNDGDGLSLLLEYMLGLSDSVPNDAMKSFSVTSDTQGKTLTAPVTLPSGYDLILQPALRTGGELPTVLLASDYLSSDRSRLEIPQLPQKLLFTVSVLAPE